MNNIWYFNNYIIIVDNASAGEISCFEFYSHQLDIKKN